MYRSLLVGLTICLVSRATLAHEKPIHKVAGLIFNEDDTEFFMDRDPRTVRRRLSAALRSIGMITVGPVTTMMAPNTSDTGQSSPPM